MKTPLPLDSDLQSLESMPKMRPEAKQQARLVAGLKRCWSNLPKNEKPIVFHIPNGGSRNALEGMNLKVQGVMPGIPDLQIVLPESRVIWIEMKAGDGKTSERQDDVHDHLAHLDHTVIVAYTAEEALDQLRRLI